MESLASPHSRVLLLGGTGFIGRWVARALSARGVPLVVAARDAERAVAILKQWGAQAEIRECDAADGDSLQRLVGDVEPDVVFNLAGYGVARHERDPAAAEQINVDLPRALIAACAQRASHVTIVHVGSAAEFGATQGHLQDDSPELPTSLYGRTKLAGTHVVRSAGREGVVRSVVARLFTVFGPGEHDGRLLPSLRAAARAGTAVELSDGQQQRDFAYVEDVATALVRLASSPFVSGESLNLATGVMRPVRAFIVEAARQLDIADERLRFGALPRLPEEMHHTGVDVQRARALLGDALPTADLSSGIARALAFESSHADRSSAA